MNPNFVDPIVNALRSAGFDIGYEEKQRQGRTYGVFSIGPIEFECSYKDNRTGVRNRDLAVQFLGQEFAPKRDGSYETFRIGALLMEALGPALAALKAEADAAKSYADMLAEGSASVPTREDWGPRPRLPDDEEPLPFHPPRMPTW